MSTATQMGAANETLGTDGADEFLRRMMQDAEKPSEEDEETPQEEAQDDEEIEEDSDESPEDDDDSDESEESDDDGEDEDADEPDDKPKVIEDDEALVKVKVDGEDREFKLKDLKRLAGQEAALTRKSQEAAEIRKKAEETGTKYVAGLETLYNRAVEKYQPYANIDFLALAKNPEISAEELSALRTEALKAYEDVRFLSQELDSTIQAAAQEQQREMLTKAKEANKVLSDPKTGIEGWSLGMYDEIRGFAINNGLPQEIVNTIVDPSIIKLLHKAMLYDKGQKAMTTKTTKVNKTPKKVIKSSSENLSRMAKPTEQKKALERLRKTGTVDDAADAFLARLK